MNPHLDILRIMLKFADEWQSSVLTWMMPYA